MFEFNPIYFINSFTLFIRKYAKSSKREKEEEKKKKYKKEKERSIFIHR